MRAIAGMFAGLTLLFIVAAAGVGAIYWVFQRPGPAAQDVVVNIPAGSGLTGIAQQLAEGGVIGHALVFRIGVTLAGNERTLRHGEYRFPAGVSGYGAMEIIRTGRPVQHFLTIPEGLSSQQVIARVEGEALLDGSVGAMPQQGVLLPDTYAFTRGADRAALVETMQEAMAATLQSLWAQRQPDLPLATPQDAVILASIIEKETGQADERAVVASVFINRLRQNMRLESDPTVIFALTRGEGELGRSLTSADLDVDSPYNTYRAAGLPPGPIANPGRESLEATLNPADTDFLFFVADGAGGHNFSRTYEEHERNVDAYWAGQRGEQVEEGPSEAPDGEITPTQPSPIEGEGSGQGQ